MSLSMNAFALSATLVGAVVTTAALHRTETAPCAPAPVPEAPASLARASELIGMGVTDTTGVRVARVHDVLVEPSSQVMVVVERQDGALAGVPLECLKIRLVRADDSTGPTVASLRLRADPERLVAATVFAPGALPTLDSVALDGVRRHWDGEEPEPRQARCAATPGALSLAATRGEAVRNPAGAVLGELSDVVLDLPSARAAYVVVACGGALGVGATPHGVAPGALRRSADRGFVVDADRKTLDNSPGIDLDRLPSRPSLQVPVKASLTDGSYAHRTPR